MITVIFLKFLHYVSLFLAGGLGVANAMLFKNHEKANTSSSASSKDNDDAGEDWISPLYFYWVTGITYFEYMDSFDLGWPFHLKMLVQQHC